MMKTMFLFISAASLALSPFAGAATAPEPLHVVKKGFSEFQEHGAGSALKAWLANRPLHTLGHRVMSEELKKLDMIQDAYGQFLDYEISRVHQVSRKSVMVFAVANFQKGALFFKFFMYKTPKNVWLVDGFHYNPLPENFWPNDMVYGGGDTESSP